MVRVFGGRKAVGSRQSAGGRFQRQRRAREDPPQEMGTATATRRSTARRRRPVSGRASSQTADFVRPADAIDHRACNLARGRNCFVVRASTRGSNRVGGRSDPVRDASVQMEFLRSSSAKQEDLRPSRAAGLNSGGGCRIGPLDTPRPPRDSGEWIHPGAGSRCEPRRLEDGVRLGR